MWRSKFWVIALVFLMACSESELEISSDRLGLAYFPMEVGEYRIYEVEETNYYLVGPQSSSYQLLEEVVDSTLISTSEVKYKLHRSKRANDTEEWELDSIWSTTLSNIRILSNENNVAFVKLVFPVINGLEWDANIYNNESSEYYRYASTLLDTTVLDQSYSAALKVIQSDQGQDIIGRDDRFEVYAQDIGLIIKKSIVWEFCQEDCSSENQIVAGRELEQVLISYGKNE